MSFIGGKGLSTTQLLNLVVNTLYSQLVEKDIKEFEGFNVGILDTFNTINMALPGKHYVAPSYKDIKDLFEQWKETNKEDQKKMFTEFINENVNLNKADESMLITAIVAPPAAMLAKKAGQVVPQLALMKAIPDVVFVPSATLLALIAIKIIKLTFIGKTTSPTTTEQEPQTTTTIEEPQIATEQEPQTRTTTEEPQIATKQEPQTTTTIEEPQFATTQEPHTTTTTEEPQIATKQEPQTTTTIEKPQIATEQESQTTTAPHDKKKTTTAIEEEPQATALPATPLEEPQTRTAPSHSRHVHKDNTFCALCNKYH